MNVEIWTEAAQIPEKEYIHKWDFPCRATSPVGNFATGRDCVVEQYQTSDTLK